MSLYHHIDISRISSDPTGIILKAIHGFRGPRANLWTLRKILAEFAGSPPEFVKRKIDELITSGKLLIVRTSTRKRCGYVYEVTESGCKYMYKQGHGTNQAEANR